MIIGSRVQRKTMGIMGYRKDSKRSSRVRCVNSEKRTGTTRTKGGVTGFDRLMDFVYLSYACILLVLSAGMLTISMALLRRSTFGRDSAAAPLDHHHQQQRRESAGSGEGRRGQMRNSQYSIWDYARKLHSMLGPPPSEGFDQMMHCGGRGTHSGKLGKRRLMRQPRAGVPHRHQRLRMAGEFDHAPTTTEAVTGTMTTIHSYVGIMPRPGEAGITMFDGKEVSTFIKNWEMDCEEYGLNAVQMCKKFPRYCTEEIGEAVEKLNGYDEGNWELFKKELKQLFWQADPPKNSIAALVKLIRDAKSGKMTVDMYVLKYTAMTQELIEKNAMSTFDRNVQLLEGLSEVVQSKVFEDCSDRKWRMLEHDVNSEEPRFEDLRDVVLAKARTMERKNIFLSGRRSGVGYLSTGATITPTMSTVPSAAPTTMTSPNSTASDLDLKDLTEQISRLTLLIDGQSQ
jgi:hypothetical protein